eukprot:TRINITY_DN2895_c0_g1_i6.p2 TRINITY_DN2895_c0_g1~~TRINITY_DN2895_c0_g1_i6.p2  ORF type:complete len:105 (-),score=22.28 TRINITY_DN2895_c0_g1_i6:290-604(-)
MICYIQVELVLKGFISTLDDEDEDSSLNDLKMDDIHKDDSSSELDSEESGISFHNSSYEDAHSNSQSDSDVTHPSPIKRKIVTSQKPLSPSIITPTKLNPKPPQ